jgi:hypothetical protein
VQYRTSHSRTQAMRWEFCTHSAWTPPFPSTSEWGAMRYDLYAESWVVVRDLADVCANCRGAEDRRANDPDQHAERAAGCTISAVRDTERHRANCTDNDDTPPTTSSSSTAASTTHRLRRRTQAQRDFLHPPRRLPAGEMKHCPNPLPKPQRHAPRPGSCHRAAGLRRQIE